MIKTTSPPAPVAQMQLIEIDSKRRILAGHHADGEVVFVLRKNDQGSYLLFRIEITEVDQTLRSFLDADQGEHMELVKAIEATMAKPRRKPRRKAK